MSKELQLSASEEQGLLALAAKSPLRGDKRTDAKAGTIHAPTAKRLCEKGLAGRKEAFGSYVLLPAGKARLPGAAALQPTEPRDCRKYLGKSPEGRPVLCISVKGHEDRCGNPDPYKPAKGKLPPNAPKADVDAMNEAAHEVIARQASKPVTAKVESRASISAKATETQNQEFIGSLPASTRAWAQECADKAIGRKPKAAPLDASRSLSDIPPVIAQALAPSPAPVPETPAMLVDALEPSAPAPVYVDVTPEINELVTKLHTTGTLCVKNDKGITFRVNAQNRGKGFEYWRNSPESGGWSRIRLGELPGVLSGVKFVSDQPEPGVRPFRPARGTIEVST